MLLTTELIDRVHALQVAVLEASKSGFERVRPEAAGMKVGTGYALFAGEGSPLTQACGFGHRTPDDPGQLESFFAPRCSNWEVTVTPFTHPETLRALLEFGYRPHHFEGALAQEIVEVPQASTFEIIEVEEGNPAWAETTWRGWTGNESPDEHADELARAVSLIAQQRRYLAFVDGVPAATAGMFEFEQGVIFGGAGTRVPYRGRGLQAALLARRMRDAGKGRFALIGALPGSSSHRNAQRAGFQSIFSSTVWMRR